MAISTWKGWRKQRSGDPSRQPLLSASDRADDQPEGLVTSGDCPITTPLPWRQLTVLCIMRTTEPISQSLIHPFINQMLEDIHVTPDRTKIGYYAGIITSLFAFSQLCTNFWWGMLSDRIGRKPILLTGLTGLSISMVSLSLQTHFIGLVLSRCFAGIMNGNLPVLKSVLAELTDDTNKARAFALLPICNAIGMIVGPMIGGYLAKPAEHFPNIFGEVNFFKTYPYFLPCFIAAMANLSAVALGFFYLEETLESKKPAPQLSRNDNINEVFVSLEAEPGKNISNSRPQLSALFTPPVVGVLIVSIFVTFQASSWATLIPLFAYTRFEDGGLGLSTKEIGSALSTNGFAAVFVQTTVFPYLQRRWGTINVFRGVLLIWPVIFALLPVIRCITQQQREVYGVETGSKVAVIGLICVLVIKSFGAMSMVCVALLINGVAPSPSTFGALNGLAQTFSAFARTFAPIISGALFSITINKHYLADSLIWLCEISVSVLAILLAQGIKIKPDQIMRRPRKVGQNPST